jgi:hypothetical protein
LIAALLALADHWEDRAFKPAADVVGGLELDFSRHEDARELRIVVAVLVVCDFFRRAKR